MEHRDYENEDRRSRRFAEDSSRTAPARARTDEYGNERDLDRDFDRGTGGYSNIRRRPDSYTPEPSAFGPAGYTPRESEQEFRAAWDERNQASYGRTYGSRSREGSYGRGMQPGSHRGRGPRGFVRSDSRISDEVHERLTDDHELDASDITVSVKDGVATLEGHVQERWMKHRAEDLTADCGGVTDVVNRIRVRREAQDL